MDREAQGAETHDGQSVARPSGEQRVAEGPTYFDITTALALLFFADRQVDAAVIEVGLGGRLDSTNVILPVVTVISSVSLDHTKQLGDTLTAIAGEKAGIFKPGVAVVSGVTAAEPRRVIRQRAQQLGCRFLEASVDFDFRYQPPSRLDLRKPMGRLDFRGPTSGVNDRYTGLRLALLGHHQAANAAVALAAVGVLQSAGWSVTERAIRRGLETVALPARVEVVDQCPTVILDSAHNVASAEALVQVLADSVTPRPRALLFAASRDKDVRGMLRVLGPQFDHVIVTRYAQNQRAATLPQLGTIASELGLELCDGREQSADAWRVACQRVAGTGLIVVTGSFFLAAEIRSLLAPSSPNAASLGLLDPASLP
jgi:dihydrofolate synthase/folylpolyglutamate synthase